MIAIRGATTIERDCAEEIRQAVRELLLKMLSDNRLSVENIVCIMFSTTSDIRSYYPAKAAREAGFYGCALYSSLEPDICGALKGCIRVMALAEGEGEGKPVHCYLRRAVCLRADLSSKINIALDGPAGSGKSTIAKILAEKLHILYLDTGAMYRAVALACIESGTACNDLSAVEKLLGEINIEVRYENGEQVTYLNGDNVNGQIRTPEVSMGASAVSALPCVREKMVALQREIAAKGSCVLDGRDIGTNVLPNARFKFFITASAEVRARRRCAQDGLDGAANFARILKQIRERDEQDITRTINPLVKATDAVEVDTGDMTIDETIELIMGRIQEKI